MVARLAERVKKSPSDPEGWIMLTRSYLSLGEKEKAATAIKDARAALADEGPTCNGSTKRCNGSKSMKRQTWHRLRLRLLPPNRVRLPKPTSRTAK
jgi:Cytochrome c biogenesis factor